MGRLLAFDFGEKRTGIAVTDELQLIASGLTTINTKELILFLKNYLAEESVELFVVGQPKQLNNEASQSAAIVTREIGNLKANFPEIPIVEVDERFTSKIAFQTMIDSGLSKKQRQNKALVDEISATLILQSYLYSK
ncbi:MAG: Holliday junction resolvase RuvX [Flavobacteriaceae bacterium]|nr:Holliday junction resolvase RuvX [Mangrovimonas sp.]MCB0469931.1 Holliday junction resolvase RuvX [Flavobacteriaceae bacterium]